MIKIIKSPDPAICDNCGCKFTYEAEDVKWDRVLDRNGFLGILPLCKSARAVRCPVCNNPVVIEWY